MIINSEGGFFLLQWVFGGMLGASLLFGLVRGNGEQVVKEILKAAQEAVEAALFMAGGFAFFCGMMAILRRAGVSAWLGKKMGPVLRLLMGRQMPEDAMDAVTMNLAANMLGLGNAATPLGLRAARRMADGSGAACNALCLFLVINSSSVQLLPSTVIALRAAEGSQAPGAVAWPAFLATLISTAAGIISCKIAERRTP